MSAEIVKSRLMVAWYLLTKTFTFSVLLLLLCTQALPNGGALHSFSETFHTENFVYSYTSIRNYLPFHVLLSLPTQILDHVPRLAMINCDSLGLLDLLAI